MCGSEFRMTTRIVRARNAGPPGESLSGASGLIERYKSAARALVDAWKNPGDFERSENLRVFESLGTLALMAALVGVGVTYDVALTRWAATLSPDVQWFFARVTHLGASGYVFALTALGVVLGVGLRGRNASRRLNLALTVLAERAFYLFTVAAVSGVASQALKHLFGRARPKLIDIVGFLHFDPFAFDATFASFPSGHAVTAFAMAVGLGYFAPRLMAPLLALAALVAASRVVIGSHYLSDVLFGAALGYASAVLVRRAFAARRMAFRLRDGKIAPRGGARLIIRGFWR